MPVRAQFPETADFVVPTPDPGNGTGAGGGSGGAGAGGAAPPTTPSHGGTGGARHTNAPPTTGGGTPTWAVPANPTQTTQVGTLAPTHGKGAANSDTNEAAAATSETGSAVPPWRRIPWWASNLLLLLVLLVVAELYRRERAKAKRPWLRPDDARRQQARFRQSL